MARRELSEINAGSMADIAFLLLVFFLVVTTMSKDSGLTRLLPPPIPPDMVDPPPVKKRNVYEVLVNFNNQLLVENNLMKVRDLKQGAKDFLLSNGDNVLKPISEPMDGFPIRKILNMDTVNLVVRSYEQVIKDLNAEKSSTTDYDELINLDKSIKEAQSAMNKWVAKQYAYEFFGDYAPLPTSALISVQNDNSTDYATYISVNNELEAAIRELRDEVSLDKFGVVFKALSPEDEQDKKKILAIRVIYPQRISEAEPLDVQGFGG